MNIYVTCLPASRAGAIKKSMRKIEIIDCCNTMHKIAMMISDDRMDFADDVYFALVKNDGLSSKQIKKLEDFRKSCTGPIMVNRYYFGDNNADHIRGCYFNWCSYDVYSAQSFIFVRYITCIEGDRDFVVRVAKDEYKGLDAIIDDIHTWRAIGSKSFDVVWMGNKIY